MLRQEDSKDHDLTKPNAGQGTRSRLHSEEDKLHVMVAINFSKRKKKMRLGQDLLQEQIRAQTPKPLTRRELLSQVSGLYDPVGLVTPAKQKGAILVHRAFQKAKGGNCPVEKTLGTEHSPTTSGKMQKSSLKNVSKLAN